MTKKRCTDCKYTKGIGYDFWCGEGHTEYEVFGAETNCPYYEYHDWSKGTPSRTEKQFPTCMKHMYITYINTGKKPTREEIIEQMMCQKPLINDEKAFLRHLVRKWRE